MEELELEELLTPTSMHFRPALRRLIDTLQHLKPGIWYKKHEILAMMNSTVEATYNPYLKLLEHEGYIKIRNPGTVFWEMAVTGFIGEL
jgi:hypothetical protein